MVVRKVMRYSPWAPPAPTTTKNKHKVRLAVTRLAGLPSSREGGGGGKVAAVEIQWKRPSRPGSLSYLMRRRRKPVRSVSREKPVGNDGVVDWEEDGDANICCFWNSELVSRSVSDPNSISPLDVSFSILYGFRDQQGRKENKLEEVGTAMVNLAEWARSCQSQRQVEEGKDSQLQVQRKQLPITLRMESLAWEATLYVTINFGETRTSKETKGTAAPGDESTKDKENQQEEQTSDEAGTDDSCIFNAEVLDLDQLILADEKDKLADYGKRDHAASNSNRSSSSSSSGISSPETGLTSKESFLSWRKRSKIASKSREIQDSSGLENKYSSTGTKKESSGSDQDDDPVGSWKGKEFISRDRETKLKTRVFFASIDQRDETAGGESACTALVAIIANALHSNGLNTPTRSEFDALIREGSSEWRKLCDNVSYIDRFPNKHFDLDTILEANIKPISVLPEKSFVGFFQPESFESLHGAMSFDDIWQEITTNIREGDPKVYIVSWNDHFFLLKVEANAYCIIDTLGERLFEGCNKAYILRFDDSTEMYRLPESSGNEGGEELHCSGKECCREFINRFLAAIPLREELEIEKKGVGTNTALHQRLQIELHFTEAANQIAA
ncbi:Argininosuccinate synthase [Cocos nucifera]|uniref:Argininosuccinate synthase n=1 Tax=Cocos nucifera TaxID=13894 RepID=A0A8K0I3X8_COCNU|nr:Argininosuccinate synthase [Cocos nucifera]